MHLSRDETGGRHPSTHRRGVTAGCTAFNETRQMLSRRDEDVLRSRHSVLDTTFEILVIEFTEKRLADAPQRVAKVGPAHDIGPADQRAYQLCSRDDRRIYDAQPSRQPGVALPR